ncbi:PTS lactose/cellobiose transporter subunit IIA [Enterococcus cecorum]|nr:PTS lactose/cellobiose transporter subunit IIA [Enterococcus cecorum]CAI3522737.1 PTS lactose/cellobiose transporter subunit IIA [Enterococcus cecorum]
MEGIELTAFSIISNVGMAKSLAVEALRDARKGKYNEAEKKMAEASEYFVKGHHARRRSIDVDGDN